jgi:hypothetical protein
MHRVTVAYCGRQRDAGLIRPGLECGEAQEQHTQGTSVDSHLYASMQLQQVQAGAQAGACVVAGGPIEMQCGQVPPNYPVNAGGFRPNASPKTPRIVAVRKNALKNQYVDFVARAMH